MYPTWIGAIVALAGIVFLIRGSVSAMMVLLMVCSLMPGSAALALPALGGSTIPPIHFALVFMLLRLCTGHPRFDLLQEALRQNAALGVYALYAVLLAFLGPRMFQGDIYVVPMKLASSGSGLHMVPLSPTAQNITSAVYLLGTFLLSLCIGAAVLHERGLRLFVKGAVAVSVVMALLGLSGALLAGTIWTDILDLFRNGNYAQTEQSFASLSRIKGISPEPSSYALSALAWFVFTFECWTRRVMPKATGSAALLLGIVLVFSTSSTAYLGLGAYAVIFTLRAIFVPNSLPLSKTLILAGAVVAGLIAIIAAMLLLPAFAKLFGDMISMMTVGKTNSDSAVERGAWAAQGISAFLATHGIGIGPGSFRSSSLFTAILGTTGLIGAISFLIHLLRILKPLRPSTYVPTEDGGMAVGVSAAWAAFLVLVPAAFIAPSGDPGPEFAIMSGAALALRWRAGLALLPMQILPALPPLRRSGHGQAKIATN